MMISELTGAGHTDEFQPPRGTREGSIQLGRDQLRQVYRCLGGIRKDTGARCWTVALELACLDYLSGTTASQGLLGCMPASARLAVSLAVRRGPTRRCDPLRLLRPQFTQRGVIPSFFMRDRRVLGFRPRRLAAFPSPLIFQPVFSRVSRISFASISLRFRLRAPSIPRGYGWVRGSSSGNINSWPGDRTRARSSTFCSSRMFPGQS